MLNYQSHLSKNILNIAQTFFNSISVDGDMSTNDTVVFSSTGNVKININNKNLVEKIFIICI